MQRPYGREYLRNTKESGDRGSSEFRQGSAYAGYTSWDIKRKKKMEA